jgi:Leucine-rich repeat (LRR) protein
LDLSANNIEDITPLMALENLRYLNLNRNRIQNASVLRVTDRGGWDLGGWVG